MTATPQETLRRTITSTNADTPSPRANSPLNVQWFGAIGDGVTEIAAGLNAAIDVANAAGGGHIIVPAGAYKCSGTAGNRILPKSNVVIEFEPGTTLTVGAPASTAYMILVDTAQEADIRNVIIKGNGVRLIGSRGTAVTQYGLFLNVQNPGDTLVDFYACDMVIEDCRTDGLSMAGNAGLIPENIVFERVICHNCYRNGASVVQARKVTFRDCWFRNTNGTSPQCGVDVEPDAGLFVYDVTFDNCKFTGNTASGLFFQAGLGTTDGGFIVNCIFESNGVTGCAIGSAKNVTITNSRSKLNTGRNWDFTNCEGLRVSNLLSRGAGSDGYRFFNQGALSAANLLSIEDVGSGFLLASVSGVNGPATFTNLNSFNAGDRSVVLSFCNAVNITGGMAIGSDLDGLDLINSSNNSIVGMMVSESSRQVDNGADNVIIEGASNYNRISCLKVSQARLFHHGTAQAGGAATVTLATTASNADDFYNNMYAYIISGTGSGGVKQITDYNGTTRVATVASNWSTPPDNTSVIEVVQNLNRPRYGIRVNAGCTGNMVTDNDAYYAGVTGAFSDAGTSTVTTSANRTS